MSDLKALGREIAARTKPRFIDTNSKRPTTIEECKALAREIAWHASLRFLASATESPSRRRSLRAGGAHDCGGVPLSSDEEVREEKKEAPTGQAGRGFREKDFAMKAVRVLAAADQGGATRKSEVRANGRPRL